ncbi:MAG: Hsp20/alpha crystallin family protein [Thermoplasmatota archaeon]
MANLKDKRMILRNADSGAFAPFGLWEDFDDLFNAFRSDVDRMFWSPVAREPAKLRVFHGNTYMPMDLEDHGDKLELSVELPGTRKEDAKISLEDNVLTISVESKQEREEKEEGRYLFRERSSMSCSRSIRLPVDVEEGKVSARMDNGILKIEMPKVHPGEKKTREIKIA